MARVVLITGGNLGDVKSRLQTAQRLINERVGVVMRCSHRYKSRPWGFDAQTLFSNQVLVIDTDLSPLEVLAQVQRIETELGRDRLREERERKAGGLNYCSRPIDIDILFFDEQVIDTPELTVPHPLLHEREFVLTPLCELMRERIHPVLGVSIGELRERLREKERA